jgi:hypothetical protein
MLQIVATNASNEASIVALDFFPEKTIPHASLLPDPPLLRRRK